MERNSSAVVVSHLHKRYGELEAVRDLSFTVTSGSLFAFLGANGAGKSTTIGCITTTLKPSDGTIRVVGFDVAREPYRVRERIGVVFQDPLLDPLLSVRENLQLRARLYGLSATAASRRIVELAELVGIGSYLPRRYGQLSGGERRRADVARALLHEPSILFLDEPTAGLDPQSRAQIWDTLGRLREQWNTTIFLTTHYMHETERADEVCIIDHGRIVARGQPAELRKQYSSSVLTLRSDDPRALFETVRQLGFEPELHGRQIEVRVSSSSQARSLLGLDGIVDFEFRHGTMDDVFLALTGRETR